MKFVLLALFLSACSSPAFEYAKARNPNCVVKKIDENADSVEVSIRCPGEDPPKIRTYKKN